MKIKIEQKAPEFSLLDQEGTVHSLSDYRGSWLLLYFYPKDDTPGCTKEACAISESLPNFKRNKLKVIGISTDSVKSHKKFAEKYSLPFTLLSDEEKEVVKKYGVWGKKKFMGKEYIGTSRISFLIDEKGVVKAIYPKVKPEEHAKEVLADYKDLKNT